MTPELEDTIRRAQSGDRDAFSRLVEQHYDAMLRFACKYCGNRRDAEDVTQQACIKLARGIRQFRFESAFSSWLYRLVINCSRDWYRSHRHERNGDPPDPATLTAPDGTEPAVMLTQVLALVQRMGEGYREVLVLVLGDGMTHAEAAEILSVSESTVSWRLHEIRKRLRDTVQSGAEV